jgi:FKBP-type peptidyl-prolyl cis-trans isomerase
MGHVMPGSGVKILSDIAGCGPEIKNGDKVRVRYDIQLNRGECLAKDLETTFTVGDRNVVAGLRYGLEGMSVGGIRRFKASPHLCYRDQELDRIPKNAVLVFDITKLDIL